MTDHQSLPSAEQIAAEIIERNWNSEEGLRGAIAAALAAKETELQAVNDELERVCGASNGQVDGSSALWQIQRLRFRAEAADAALTQARARVTRLEQALEHEKALGLGKHLSTREGVTSVYAVVRLAPLEEALRATSPEEPHK